MMADDSASIKLNAPSAPTHQIAARKKSSLVVAILTLVIGGLSGQWQGGLSTAGTFAGAFFLAVAIQAGGPWIWRLELAVDRFGQSRYALLILGIFAFLCAMGLSFYAGDPVASVHDEFSYLLAADTFAHGRLSNPTPPMWVHFETVHVFQQPTYASKYPPGQGMILALGQLLWKPTLGVWISTAIAIMAVYWMLKQWTAPRWACFGALLLLFNPLMVAWTSNFMGGQLPLAGGALLVGGARRAISSSSVSAGLIAGLGLSMLANTRPYEGSILAVSLLVTLVLAAAGRKIKIDRGRLKRFTVGLAGVLSLTAAWICFYNYRVTGSATKLPYSVYEDTYAFAPVFLWQKPHPMPAYRHPQIAALYTGPQWYNYAIGHAAYLSVLRQRLEDLYLWHCSKNLIPLLLIGLLVFSRKGIWAMVGLAVYLLFLAGIAPVETFFNPHYFAPGLGVGVLVLVMGLRRLSTMRWRGERLGLVTARVAAASLLALSLLAGGAYAQWRRKANSSPSWSKARLNLAQSLTASGGRHLIIVRYLPENSLEQEWVYNNADINTSPIIWAQDMGDEENAKLMNSFKDRKAWLLVAGPGSASLSPILAAGANP